VQCLAVVVVDEEFRHPRLAALYDALDPDRGDLQAYSELVAELGADRVLDVGCGTGRLALLLAAAGRDVIGVDPAGASLAVARAKPGAHQVRWVEGDATTVTVTDRDVALLTGNTAQAITDPGQWAMTLQVIRSCLRPGGHLAFETRDPAARAWEQWTRAATHRISDVPGAGRVESWVEVTAVEWPLVSFCWTWVFACDGASLTSSSTLRFRDRSEVESDLHASGFEVLEVRGAPDRPGQELVFLARRPDRAPQRADPAVT
jgi:SAM-dependent methyltransferase